MSNGSPTKDKDHSLLSGDPPLDKGVAITDSKGDKKPDPPITDKGSELTPRLQELMEKKGFKSPDELVEYAENLERHNTKLHQESGLSIYNTPLTNNPETQKRERETTVDVESLIPEDPEKLFTDRDRFKQFVVNMRNRLTDDIRGDIDRERDEAEAHTVWVEAQRLIKKDPAKFNQLRPIMLDLHKQYPKAPVGALYEEAEVIAESQEKVGLETLKKKLGLEGVDVDRLKTLLDKTRPPHISDSGGTSITDIPAGNLTQKQKEDKIVEAILASDKLLE